jgi:ABC-type phosphate transport system permease subunit
LDLKERMIEKFLLLIALSSISILALITFFIFGEGLPLIWKIGPKAFLLGERSGPFSWGFLWGWPVPSFSASWPLLWPEPF